MAKTGNLLVISWNPGGNVIAAGGLRRAAEIINRFPHAKGRVIIIDTHPTYYDTTASWVTYYPYYSSRLVTALTRVSFTLGRIMEWSSAALKIFYLSYRHRREYDLVYVPFSEMFVVAVPGYLIKLFLRKEVIFCNQNKDNSPLELWLNNRLHNRADKIISVSNQLASELEQQGKKKPVYVGMVGLNYDEVVSARASVKRFDALFIGRHVASKGVLDYAKMIVALVKENPDFTFASIGICDPGNWHDIQSILRQGGAEANWQYLGIVDDKEKYQRLKQARVVWFLSTLEGWGIVPQEALAAEVTPICYDIPVYREHIKKTRAALMVPVSDWRAALATYKRFLKLPPAELKAMHREGKEFVRQYNWDRVAAREFALIYDETDKVKL